MSETRSDVLIMDDMIDRNDFPMGWFDQHNKLKQNLYLKISSNLMASHGFILTTMIVIIIIWIYHSIKGRMNVCMSVTDMSLPVIVKIIFKYGKF